jgi:hypothetical protein
MVNYQLTKIYKIVPIVPHDEGDIYIGSTSLKYLSSRFALHKTEYRRGLCDTTAKILFDKYGLDNCIIELLELYPCNSVEERSKKEGEYHTNFNCVNRCVAGRTSLEYQKKGSEKYDRILELKRIRYAKKKALMN